MLHLVAQGRCILWPKAQTVVAQGRYILWPKARPKALGFWLWGSGPRVLASGSRVLALGFWP